MSYPPLPRQVDEILTLPELAKLLKVEAIVGKRGVSIAVGAIVGRRDDDARRHVGGPGV